MQIQVFILDLAVDGDGYTTPQIFIKFICKGAPFKNVMQ